VLSCSCRQKKSPVLNQRFASVSPKIESSDHQIEQAKPKDNCVDRDKPLLSLVSLEAKVNLFNGVLNIQSNNSAVSNFIFLPVVLRRLGQKALEHLLEAEGMPADDENFIFAFENFLHEVMYSNLPSTEHAFRARVAKSVDVLS